MGIWDDHNNCNSVIDRISGEEVDTKMKIQKTEWEKSMMHIKLCLIKYNIDCFLMSTLNIYKMILYCESDRKL